VAVMKTLRWSVFSPLRTAVFALANERTRRNAFRRVVCSTLVPLPNKKPMQSIGFLFSEQKRALT
ncbi:MAG: hypothetical protein IJZ08_04430, partial [Clostridia bacterium]|nr:hypothetical protein [Clostridia bacterium]